MKIAKSIFWAVTIILFAIGAWPLSILTATVGLTLSIVDSIQTKKKLQDLEAENQKLQAELQAQTVRRAMDAAEKREKD